MVKIEQSIRNLRLPEFSMDEEVLTQHGMNRGGELYERIERDIFAMLGSPEDPTEAVYDNSFFRVLKTFYRDDYMSGYQQMVGQDSYHIISIGLEGKFLVVRFELTPDETDPDFGILSYGCTHYEYGLIDKGYYSDYLFSVNGFYDII